MAGERGSASRVGDDAALKYLSAKQTPPLRLKMPRGRVRRGAERAQSLGWKNAQPVREASCGRSVRERIGLAR